VCLFRRSTATGGDPQQTVALGDGERKAAAGGDQQDPEGAKPQIRNFHACCVVFRVLISSVSDVC
jgi:hypothetical protein